MFTRALFIVISAPLAVAALVVPVQGATPQQISSTANLSSGTSVFSEVSQGISVKKKETAAQRNAKNTAKSYLQYSSFSRKGLINQLKYEGFSTKDATYGVDACKANWKQQAVKTAKSYLKYSSFSKSGLIDQLIYEGFTTSEARYGVKVAYK